MGKFTISIGEKTGITYFPKELRKEGFVGRVEGLPNALTLTLIKPGASLTDVEKSLKILLQDIKLRRQYKEAQDEKRTS